MRQAVKKQILLYSSLALAALVIALIAALVMEFIERGIYAPARMVGIETEPFSWLQFAGKVLAAMPVAAALLIALYFAAKRWL